MWGYVNSRAARDTRPGLGREGVCSQYSPCQEETGCAPEAYSPQTPNTDPTPTSTPSLISGHCGDTLNNTAGARKGEREERERLESAEENRGSNTKEDLAADLGAPPLSRRPNFKNWRDLKGLCKCPRGLWFTLTDAIAEIMLATVAPC